jgi:tetratricopeptide (TPR) repeat protein
MKIDYNKVAAGKTVNNTVSGDDECRRIIDFYNQSIQNGNENSSTHNSLGIAYALKGDFDSAIVCFNRAIELNHDNWDAYYNRGLVFCKNDRLSEAVSDFKVIHDKAALDKNIGIIYDASYQLGMLHIALGDIQSGVSYLQALNDNPDYEEASLILKELTKEGLL